MSDITFTRGYGFPRGSAMDFAGYTGGRGGFGGMLVNNPPRALGRQIPVLPEPSLFEKMPAMDGFGDFGTEYNFEPQVLRRLGDMVLPTWDANTNTWRDVNGNAVDEKGQPIGASAPGAAGAIGALAVVAGLWYFFGR